MRTWSLQPEQADLKGLTWTLATPTTAPMTVKMKRMQMTKRTKGSNLTPPPGSIICAKKDVIFSNVYGLKLGGMEKNDGSDGSDRKSLDKRR